MIHQTNGISRIAISSENGLNSVNPLKDSDYPIVVMGGRVYTLI
jgi:hypothetical protein